MAPAGGTRTPGTPAGGAPRTGTPITGTPRNGTPRNGARTPDGTARATPRTARTTAASTTGTTATGRRRRATPPDTARPDTRRPDSAEPVSETPGAPGTPESPADAERREARPTGAARANDAEEVRRIDETLTRLTAAHAGVTLARTDADAPAPLPERVRVRPGIAQVLVAVLALAVFAVTAFQYVGKARLDAAVTQVTALDPDSGAIVDADAQAGDENVLIVGTEPAGAAGGAPTDTVLLAHVPAGGGDVVGVSVPHDLEVNRPPCRRWDPAARDYLDETVPAQARTPLMSAFQVGGPQCVTRVVQQLTGLAVTRFVGLDLDGIGDLVDAVGGVDVCVEQPVVDGLLGPVVPAAGTTSLNGVRARDFVAARTVAGDPAGGRGVLERQQRLVTAVLEKTLSREVLLDPARTGSLGPALGAALTADDADLDRILATARSVRTFAAEGVTFTAVPTSTETSGQGNTLVRDADAAALFAALREGTPLPDQTVLAAGAGPAPADVTLDILNASDQQGLAAEIGGTLETLGFGVDEIGNAPQPAPDTVVRFSPDRAAAAELLAATVPSARTVPDPGESGVLQLVLGRSFDGVVRAPSTTPSAATPVTPPATCT
ncbi:LCP family protein [Pseudonocardia broussonetiae]|uniref:LCP family protein n=1 Tax=Pseudonocardia broussonetiae TaxID=2736640 RepID=A0A6M6JEE7_9PSEU|nr:LCP family protein [Pseudonocardia broussonetiae]QJY45347.1 LCP family protein [Pseudonocardia broussonetiae]